MKKLKQNWVKVKNLRKGMKIGVPTSKALADFGFGDGKSGKWDKGTNCNIGQDREWDEIVEIKKVGEERVYDIEVEGTHNFVAGNMIDKGKTKWYGGIFAHNTYLAGNATTTGYLEVGTPTGSPSAGDVNISGTYKTNGADYAEYFYTEDIDLEPGELVSIDIVNNGAVKRSSGLGDSNIMGIVSSNPSIIGNTGAQAEWGENSVVVGLLGQVQAKVSNENGAIRSGDSLTAGAVPGVLMKANAGDATVGVALENLDQLEGKILVLISRRNKSLTVEQVEEQITERVADMEIEDEVNLLVAGAMDNLGVEAQMNEINLRVMELEQQFNGLRVLGEFNEIEADKIIVKEFRVAGVATVDGNVDVKGSVYAEEGIVENIATRVLNLEEISQEFINSNLQNSTSTATTTQEQVATTTDEFLSLPKAGDVLVIDLQNDNSAIKNYEKNSNQILGIATEDAQDGKIVFAINGSVDVKISLENGEIKKGDLLTTSSMPGYAMKARNKNAGILGIALEDYDQDGGDKLEILLAVKNNLTVNWDDVSVSVIDNPSLNDEAQVVEHNFDGKITVQDLVVEGKVSVVGEAEFLSEVTFKSNLNLAGAIMREYQQAVDENLNIGDAVYISGSNIVSKAYSNVLDEDNNFKPAIGLVVEITEKENNKFIKVAIGGTINGFKNLVPGSIYYLNGTNNIDLNNNATSTATTTQELIEMESLTNAPEQEIGNYIQSIGIAESENSLLILPSLIYEEYTEDVELPSVNYNPIYIEEVIIEQKQPTSTKEIIEENPEEIVEPEEPEVIVEEIPNESEVEVVPEPVINPEPVEIIETPVIEEENSESETEVAPEPEAVQEPVIEIPPVPEPIIEE